MTETQINTLKSAIHTVKDYPKAGIMFRDVTGILDDATAFKLTIDILANKFKDGGFTKVVGTEARGFIFGAPLALALGVGFVPVRKPGKLPRETFSQAYQLEYGEDCLEIQKEALSPGDKVALIDDVLATGGTAQAAQALIEKAGAEMVSSHFLLEIDFLKGRDKLQGEIQSFIKS